MLPALLATVAVAWLLAPIVEVLLLGFAGLLLGIFLQALGSWLAARLHLPGRVGAPLVCMAFLGLIVGCTWLAVPAVGHQVNDLADALPRALLGLVKRVERFPWGHRLVTQTTELLGSNATLARAPRILSSTLGTLASGLAFTLIGIFVSLEPDAYLRRALRLAPPQQRAHLREVLADVGHSLRLWMLAKVGAMLFVGLTTWLGLLLLGSPLALVLAVIAAALTFIPNFGPVAAAAPAVLLGFMDGPVHAGYVVLLYVGVQVLESYLVTPLLERRMISMPPAVTVVMQLAMGAAVGGIGLLTATPLLVACIVLIRRLYIEDVLERPAAET